MHSRLLVSDYNCNDELENQFSIINSSNWPVIVVEELN